MKEGPAPTMFALLQAAHAVETRVEEALEKVDLSGAKFVERLTCVRSNITQLVDRLEADGLVRRVDDPDDRRSKRAEVTALGRKRQAAGAKQVEALEAKFTRTLSGVDSTTFRAALAALR
jgi:DNA-binding MarR family transcriptional regulator